MTHMTPTQKLHTYARRYCIDRHNMWTTKYAKLVKDGGDRCGSNYTEKAHSIFPRYNVLSAILSEVQRLDPDDLPSLEELSELLVLAGELANTAFTQGLKNETAISVTEIERRFFIDEVSKAASHGTGFVEPLCYLRVLTDIEVKMHRGNLRKRWGADRSHWYPLSDKTHDNLDFRFLEDVDKVELDSKVDNFLSELKVPRIYELREFGDSYELEKGSIECCYNGAEGYWFDKSLNWVVYCSHEGTITMGGSITSVLDTFPHKKSWFISLRN